MGFRQCSIAGSLLDYILLDYMKPIDSLAIREPDGQILSPGIRLRSVCKHVRVADVKVDQIRKRAHAVWQGPCEVVVAKVEILKACLVAQGGRQSACQLVSTSLNDLAASMAGSLISK